MDKKKILIIVGIVAVGGIGFYLWNKSKKTAEGGAEGGAEAPADATTKTAEAPADATKSATAKTPLNTRKEKKKACGRKPLNKNKKAEWQKCVDAGGTASFEGDFDQWQNDYMDFSGLNLDL
jgi:hypothetical protein